MNDIALFLTISLVATVALDRNQTMLTEGNDTMNQTLMFNVVLMDDEGGLDRDVIINISAIEISATGTWTVCYYRNNYSQQL